MPIFCQQCRSFLAMEGEAYRVLSIENDFLYYHIEHLPEGVEDKELVRLSDVLPTLAHRKEQTEEYKLYMKSRTESNRQAREEFLERDAEILRERESGIKGSVLALKYGVSETRIFNICNNLKRKMERENVKHMAKEIHKTVSN